MGRKLLLTIALAVLGAVSWPRVRPAPEVGGLIASGSSGVAVDLPGGQNLPPVEPAPGLLQR